MHHVVVGALVRDGRVLLVHRRPEKRVNPGVWDLPGGVVEPGESELEGLVRELEEELGVLVDPATAARLDTVVVGPDDDPARLTAWLVDAWTGAPTNRAPEEHDDLAWFGLDDLPPPPHVVVREALVQAVWLGAGRED